MKDMDVERMLREQRQMLWATAACAALGLLIGTAVLWGASRPFSGDGSVIIPIALTAGLIAAAAFIVSSRMHRPGETAPMPLWQAVVSNISAVAVTAALAGVTGLGVLLAGEVLPLMRERYAVSAAAARTGIFGASLGGLGAFDTAWRRPQLFGLAGIFSGALWWRTDNSSVAAQQASRIAHRLVRESAVRPPLRLWFEAGTRDETADRDGNGVIDAIQDTTELIDELVAKGFVRDRDVAYHQIEGGEHHESTWARALPEFLRWAWPARPGAGG